MPSSNTPALDPARTTWHITFGTYGTRLHGGERPAVDRKQNQYGQPFIVQHAERENFERQNLARRAVFLTAQQRGHIESHIPAMCRRGGWRLRVCAAGPDHVHVLCDADRSVHGKQIRALIKRWLTQSLNQEWPISNGGSWWAKGGSNQAVKEADYLANAYRYIRRQRVGGKPDECEGQ